MLQSAKETSNSGEGVQNATEEQIDGMNGKDAAQQAQQAANAAKKAAQQAQAAANAAQTKANNEGTLESQSAADAAQQAADAAQQSAQAAQDAANARQAEEEAVRAYWENVNNVITKRNIAGYKIPESFTKEVNGQKVTLTPDDFYDYLYRAKEVDANGNKITGYQRDLDKLTDEELLNKELLDAWLMFTGGTYKDLVNMAIKEHEVRKLIVKSKEQRSSRTIKVVKPTGKANINDVVLD